jgi:hypothetical protein
MTTILGVDFELNSTTSDNTGRHFKFQTDFPEFHLTVLFTVADFVSRENGYSTTAKNRRGSPRHRDDFRTAQNPDRLRCDQQLNESIGGSLGHSNDQLLDFGLAEDAWLGRRARKRLERVRQIDIRISKFFPIDLQDHGSHHHSRCRRARPRLVDGRQGVSPHAVRP